MKLYYFSSASRELVLKKILKNGIEVEKVFITDPKDCPKIQLTIDIADQSGIPVVVLDKKDLGSFFGDLNPNVVCLSAGFKYLFPPNFIDYFHLILNVHGTLLPHYAGSKTLNWVIVNGEKWSGVTVHKVDAGMDTGPILLQKKFPVTPFDTGKSLRRKTLESEPSIVVEALQMVAGGNIRYIEQNYDNVPMYPNRTPDHSKINPNQPLIELIDEIRASDLEKYPAFFDYHGEKLGIKLFRLGKKNKDDDTL